MSLNRAIHRKAVLQLLVLETRIVDMNLNYYRYRT